MRMRVVKSEYWKSPRLAGLSWDARLMLVGLWSYVEDNGVGLASPGLMAAELFPFDNPDASIPRITKAVGEICGRGIALRFRAEVDGAELALIEVTDWEQWQKPDKPSHTHYPRSNSAKTVGSSPRGTRESPESNSPPGGGGGIGVRSSEIGVRRGEESRESLASPTPPSRFCLSHPNGTETPCGPCKDARIAYEAWEREHPPLRGADAKAMEWQALKASFSGQPRGADAKAKRYAKRLDKNAEPEYGTAESNGAAKRVLSERADES